MNLIVQVSGFTDGVPVSRKRKYNALSLAEEISQFCKIDDKKIDDKQLNECLSQLRAGEMYKLINKGIEYLKPNPKILGYGKILASDNKDNPKIRKCEISVVFIPINNY